MALSLSLSSSNKVAVCRPGRDPIRNQLDRHLDPGLRSLQNRENIYLLFEPPSPAFCYISLSR